MKCFSNGLPDISPKDHTQNIKNASIYHHIAQLHNNNKCNTYNGNTTIDCSGYLVKTDSFDTFFSLTYGQALCAPCDISSSFISDGGTNCTCEIVLGPHLINSLIQALDFGVSGEFLAGIGIGPTMTVPWSFLMQPDGWNSWGLIYDSSGQIATEICDISGSTFAYDGSQNILIYPDTNYGGIVCLKNINNLFGGACQTNYYPTGTVGAWTNDAFGIWLYMNPSPASGSPAASLRDALLARGYSAARPSRTKDNYLQRVNGMHLPAPIRFFLAKE